MQVTREEVAAAIEAVADYEAQLDALDRATAELLTLRIENAGRPVNMKAYAELQALKARVAPMASMHMLNGEARGVAVLDSMLLLEMDPVAAAVGSDVKSIVKEFAIAGRGRVDRAVFHESGRLSLIEAKDGGSARDVVAGIGQVLLYKGMLERTTSWNPIVPMLAVLHDRDDDIARACSLAGVTYLPLGDVAWMRALSRLLHVTYFAPVA